jgi:hypothetical protein
MALGIVSLQCRYSSHSLGIKVSVFHKKPLPCRLQGYVVERSLVTCGMMGNQVGGVEHHEETTKNMSWIRKAGTE